jgi:hypothetical protein
MKWVLIAIGVFVIFIAFTEKEDLKKFVIAMLLADLGNYIVLNKSGVLK